MAVWFDTWPIGKYWLEIKLFHFGTEYLSLASFEGVGFILIVILYMGLFAWKPERWTCRCWLRWSSGWLWRRHLPRAAGSLPSTNQPLILTGICVICVCVCGFVFVCVGIGVRVCLCSKEPKTPGPRVWSLQNSEEYILLLLLCFVLIFLHAFGWVFCMCFYSPNNIIINPLVLLIII